MTILSLSTQALVLNLLIRAGLYNARVARGSSGMKVEAMVGWSKRGRLVNGMSEGVEIRKKKVND